MYLARSTSLEQLAIWQYWYPWVKTWPKSSSCRKIRFLPSFTSRRPSCISGEKPEGYSIYSCLYNSSFRCCVLSRLNVALNLESCSSSALMRSLFMCSAPSSWSIVLITVLVRRDFTTSCSHNDIRIEATRMCALLKTSFTSICSSGRKAGLINCASIGIAEGQIKQLYLLKMAWVEEAVDSSSEIGPVSAS